MTYQLETLRLAKVLERISAKNVILTNPEGKTQLGETDRPDREIEVAGGEVRVLEI